MYVPEIGWPQKWRTMKANLNRIQKHRHFSEEFKKQIVKDFESGQFSVLELERLHKIRNKSIYDWIYKYSTFNKKGYRLVESKSSSSKKVKDLEEEANKNTKTASTNFMGDHSIVSPLNLENSEVEKLNNEIKKKN